MEKSKILFQIEKPGNYTADNTSCYDLYDKSDDSYIYLSTCIDISDWNFNNRKSPEDNEKRFVGNINIPESKMILDSLVKEGYIQQIGSKSSGFIIYPIYEIVKEIDDLNITLIDNQEVQIENNRKDNEIMNYSKFAKYKDNVLGIGQSYPFKLELQEEINNCNKDFTMTDLLLIEDNIDCSLFEVFYNGNIKNTIIPNENPNLFQQALVNANDFEVQIYLQNEVPGKLKNAQVKSNYNQFLKNNKMQDIIQEIKDNSYKELEDDEDYMI